MSNDMLGRAVRKLAGLQDHVLPVAIDLLTKLSDPEWLAATKRFLRKENPWPRTFIWKKIWIGRHKNAKAICATIESKGDRITDQVKNYELDRIAYAQRLEEIGLVKASGFELCGRHDVTIAEVLLTIRVRGRLCPQEAGPALRDLYTDQPKGETLLIATKPILDESDASRLFYVGCDSDGLRWLSSIGVKPDNRVSSKTVWVFMVPKKQ